MRLLLLRTSALGDVVHALPVLTALRRNLPSARLGWVVEAPYAPLLDGHPDLDELLVVRLRAWRRRPLAAETRREVGDFARRLADFGADVALDLMGNHKGALLAALTFADRRIGLAAPLRREPTSALWLSERVTTGGAHAVDRGLALLGALGLPAEPADFAADRWLAALASRLPTTPSAAARGYIFIHPGAAWGNKRYPARSWGEVCRRLGEQTGSALRIGSGPGEEELAAEVVAASRGAAELAPAGDLLALIGLLRDARLVLAGDTGPLHLAHALGRPVLCLMGPTDPRTHGPYGASERALVHPLPCSYCHKRMEAPRACLIQLRPEQVAERAAVLLAGCDALD